ncbi:hypothetical protein QUB80_06585 [Chlorogloeopsis sp. ULAP01]|uniref:hypothetical protein n=1 Tax=Chlorogloeopsis sp. ULAP01 TaxID=3056483 RepID=UPI0025AA7E3C|nr:hypothetical protein [Chlorogloeopsis sp. ULAP01]MDM9380368.1 hypothetical protein [Chlorogloeopsis sp. ULAP01]
MAVAKRLLLSSRRTLREAAEASTEFSLPSAFQDRCEYANFVTQVLYALYQCEWSKV